jgi:hypothetical protein
VSKLANLHTPGPWMWDGVNAFIAPNHEIHLDGKTCEEHGHHWSECGQAVLMIGCDSGEFEENGDSIYYPELKPNEADTRLIASAPDLLQALQTIAKSTEQHSADGVCDFETLQLIAKAAIFKATGEF